MVWLTLIMMISQMICVGTLKIQFRKNLIGPNKHLRFLGILHIHTHKILPVGHDLFESK